MSREAFHLLLERYLENRCTDEEKEIVEKWYGMLDRQDIQNANTTEINVLEEKLWERIHNEVLPVEQESALLLDKPRVKSLIFRLSAAAILVGMMLTAGYLFFVQKNNQSEYPAFAVSEDIKVYTNDEVNPVTIKLEDGSSVTLQPQTVLKYPLHFSKTLREVSLEGEGFFEISKNPEKPFLVYNKNVITRVVGTSFIVKTTANKNETEVIVKTGKVIVSPNSINFSIKDLMKSEDGVVLTPNQKTVYNATRNTFATSLVDQPVSIDLQGTKALVKEYYLFNDTPVGEVLSRLQKSYGIEFIVEDRALYNYTFTGDLSEQNLYSQLDFLCESIKASYSVKGTKIIISAKE